VKLPVVKEYFPREHIVKEGQVLRRGYTTGTCAAAAARAAASMLFSGEKLDCIEVTLPSGATLRLPLQYTGLEKGKAVCSVKKEAGDDPDVTDGVEIYARVGLLQGGAGVEVCAGEGIGMVTRPGLEVEVGQPAINPAPMRMIKSEVEKELPPEKGVRVELVIPGGEELAQKTFNPRLGIQGGLSILGTTGIVEPMSSHAVQESLALEVKMHAPGCDGFAVLVPGNYGKETARGELGLPEKNIFKMSNYAGFMLDRCIENSINRILLVGHPGKLLKLAAGIFQTHSRKADARFEILAAYAALRGVSRECISLMQESVNTEEMVELLENEGAGGMFPVLAAKISARAEEYTGFRSEVGTVLFTLKKGIIARDEGAAKMLEEWKCPG